MKDLTLELDSRSDLVLEQDGNDDLVLENIPAAGGTNDYEKLINKPSIAGVTLIGDKELSDFVPDYIIIDGGVASGYAES